MRIPAALTATALFAATITVGVATSTPARADVTPPLLPAPVLQGQAQTLIVANGATSAYAQVGGIDDHSSGTITMSSGGTLAWLDKSNSGGGQDSKYYPIAVNTNTVGPAVSVSDCNGLNTLRVAPTDDRLAMLCPGSGTVKITSFNGTVLHSTALAGATDVIWSQDGTSLWAATPGGLAGINTATGALVSSGVGGSTGHVRALRGGSLVAIAAKPLGTAQQNLEEVATGANGVLGAVITRNASLLDPNGQIAVSPDNTKLWHLAGNNLQVVDLTAFNSGDANSTATVIPQVDNYGHGYGQQFKGLALDSLGTTVYLSALRPKLPSEVHGPTYTDLLFDDTRNYATGHTAYYFGISAPDNIATSNPAVGHPVAPTASFVANVGLAGQTSTFTANGTTYQGTSTAGVTYKWTVDSVVQPTTTATLSTTLVGGSHSVSLEVVDPTGQGGPSTTYWDGEHYYAKGSANAVATKLVAVPATSAITLTTDTTQFDPGGHVTLTAHLTTNGNVGSTFRKIRFLRNGTDINSPAGSSPVIYTDDNPTVTFTGPTENTPGTYSYQAVFDGDGTIPSAQSDSIAVTVNTNKGNAVLSPDLQEIATGATLNLSSHLTNCGFGSYQYAVDSVVNPSLNFDNSGNSVPGDVPVAVTGLADGIHTVHTTYTPSDSSCLSSTSPDVRAKVGTSATTTFVDVASPARPGSQSISVTVTSPGGTPFSGTVALSDGAAVLESKAMDPSGTTTFTEPISAYGSHPLTATFTHTGTGWTGSTSDPTALLVDDVPAAPAITAVTPAAGQLTVALAAPDAHGSPVTSYNVICVSPGQPVGTAAGAGTSLVVGGLAAGVDYSCTATATNAAGISPTSAAAVGHTPPGAPVIRPGSPDPVSITGTAPKPGALVIGVKKPNDHGSAIKSYTVTCTRPGGPNGTGSGAGPTITVTGLLNNADYLCSATATNAVGTGAAGPQFKGRPGRLPDVTLSISHTTVAAGSHLVLKGTVTAAGQAQANRKVTITFRAKTGKKRPVVATATTNSKGQFTAKVTIKVSGAYQVTAPIGPSRAQCKEKLVTVKAGARKYL